MPNASEPKYLTVAEAARELDVAKPTIMRLVHGGDLQAVKVGRLYKIPRAVFEDFVAANTTGARS